MPNLILKPCSTPGCPNDSSSGQCESCRAKREDRKQRAPFYGTNKWKQASLRYRRKHPLCELCLDNGFTTQSALTDHIHEIEDGGPKMSRSNFMALCSACSNRKTKQMANARQQGHEAVMDLVSSLQTRAGR